MKNQRNRGGKAQDRLNVNTEITADTMRVIDNDGNMVGVISRKEALYMARDRGLDLVEVTPTSDPVVCKIIDYGKFMYNKHKKVKEAKKKQVTINIKEVKLRINIGEHDYQVKLRNARKFIESGDKLKVTLRFRGREIVHQDLAKELFKRMKADLEDIAKPELDIKMENRQIMMILVQIK